MACRSMNFLKTMSKKKTNNPDTVQELMLMRMSIQAMRDLVNQNLNAMVDQINRLLPPEDHTRYQRKANFTKEDWGEFLTFYDGK